MVEKDPERLRVGADPERAGARLGAGRRDEPAVRRHVRGYPAHDQERRGRGAVDAGDIHHGPEAGEVIRVGAEGHEAAADHRHRAQEPVLAAQRRDELEAGRLAQTERHFDQPSRLELLVPGTRNISRARRDDDAVVRSAAGVALPAVAGDDGDARSLQRTASARRGVGIDVHRHHPPGLSHHVPEERGVVSGARTDLQHALPRLELELLQHLGHDPRLRRRGKT